MLTYPGAGAIVDEETFPADEKLADEEIVGSGPYKLSQYKAGDQAVLEINEEYTGDNTGKAPQVFVKYYSEPSALKLAVENGEVDVAWRSLSPTGHRRPRGQRRRHGRRPVRAPRSATGCGRSTARSARTLPIRQAAAQVFDREAIAENAYDGTVDPLYSIVPPGYAGADGRLQGRRTASPTRPRRSRSSTTPASRRRSTSPSAGRPRTTARTPRTRRTRCERQLEESGLFDVDAEEHRVGAVPDHLQGGCLRPLPPRLVPRLPGRRRLPVRRSWSTVASSRTATPTTRPTSSSPRSRAPTTRPQREEIFGQLQDIAAADVPFIPSWVGKNIGVYGAGMEGVEDTLDPAFIFRFWLVSKNA